MPKLLVAVAVVTLTLSSFANAAPVLQPMKTLTGVMPEPQEAYRIVPKPHAFQMSRASSVVCENP
jgi:hypothetical protein